jgi:hypothetical protein
MHVGSRRDHLLRDQGTERDDPVSVAVVETRHKAAIAELEHFLWADASVCYKSTLFMTMPKTHVHCVTDCSLECISSFAKISLSSRYKHHARY